MDTAEPIQELINAARAGDAASTERLLALVRPHLERIAHEYADPDRVSESTADLVQEAWLRAWQRLSQFRGDAGDDRTLPQFLAWVGQIAHRLGLNARRDRRAQRRRPAGRAVVSLDPAGSEMSAHGGDPPLAALGSTPSLRARRDEEAEIVRRALASLPDPLGQEIVRLRVFEGLSLRATADRLGVTLETVRWRYESSLRILEQRLGGLE